MREEMVRGVQHHLWSSDSQPAYRGIHTLRSSKPVPLCTEIRAEGGGLLTEGSEVKALWAGYFGQLYQADPPPVELDVRDVPIPIADPPINCDPPLFVETRAVVNRLKWGKGPGMCGFSRLVEMLYSCRCMQFCALHGTQASSQLTGRGALLFLYGKGRVIARISTTTKW